MVRRFRPNLTLLALLTASGVLSAGQGLRPVSRELIASLRIQEPARVAQITRTIESNRSALGLGMMGGVREFNRITDEFGTTHARYHQLYRGVEVYGGVVLGHMDALGNQEAPHATVQQEINLEPATLLAETQISNIVERDLARFSPEGRLLPMKVERIVFPTKYQDGLKVVRDTKGQLTLDTRYSVATPRKAEPYRWAYRVATLKATPQGPIGTNYVIDGLTGEILKKNEGSHHVDTPSVGTGNSQYNGMVSLNTLRLMDSTGNYTLSDTVRGTLPWPNPGWTSLDDLLNPGIQTRCYDFNKWTTSGTVAFSNATNTWGDGLAFNWATDFPAQLETPHGETAGVDAHYGIQRAWDYYANVLGRTGGIDGQGTSPVIFVHQSDFNNPWPKTAWYPEYFMIRIGDGAPTGSFATLDVMAHEFSHGVMSYTANLDDNHAECGDLNEANSDIHGTMVKFYAWGTDGNAATVPDTTTAAPGGHNSWDYLWGFGNQLSADGVTPLRSLYKPSMDTFSYDAWFDGIGIDDIHYGSGPGRRAFYFLSQGSSGDVTKETYSPYLPSGMAGIGNDKALRIWYRAMTTKVTDLKTDYHAFRGHMIDAAAELFPSGSQDSAEVAAVKNAFAAVNVGAPEGGAEPVMVSFPVVQGSMYAHPKIQVVPMGIPVTITPPVVSNATNTALTWSQGGLSPSIGVQGRFLDDGRYLAPTGNTYSVWCPVKATSNQDPKQFAVDVLLAYNLDCDSDLDVDACDMGALAICYNYPSYSAVYPAANLWGTLSGVEDSSVELFLEGFNNAFAR